MFEVYILLQLQTTVVIRSLLLVLLQGLPSLEPEFVAL